MKESAAGFSIKHIWWLLVSPRKLAEFEHEDMKRRNSPPREPYYERAFAVRSTMLWSLVKTTLSLIGGVFIVWIASVVSDAPAASKSMILAIIGALMILFGTLSIGDAATRSLEGTSIIERTNKRVFDFLLCAGTAFLVAAGIVAL